MSDDQRSGDPIESLFRERYGEFVALAAVIVRDRAAAEEIVQDAFAATIGRQHPLDDPSKLGGYVAQAVVNGARGTLRRRATEQQPRPFDPTMATDPSTPPSDARTAMVLDAVLQLPERQAQCVVCRHLLDMTFPDIASTLGISQATAKTHVRRGTAQLATSMKEHP